MSAVTGGANRDGDIVHCPVGLAVIVAWLAVLGSITAAARPIDIGNRKQLLVDDYVVARLDGVSRVFNQPEKFEGNPVLRPEMPWEGGRIYVSSVIYDPDEGLFKMWYRVLNLEFEVPPRPYEQYPDLLKAAKYRESDTVCYVTSRDGVRWERPALGLVEFKGSSANNLLPPVAHGTIHNFAGIIKDSHEPDPARRYKCITAYPRDREGRYGVAAYFSPDGLRWRDHPGNPVIAGTSDVHTLLGWDESISAYVAYVRPGRDQPPGLRAGERTLRVISYSTSRDFESWTSPVPVLVPDSEDPVDVQFYAMPAFRYEGLYFGLPWVFRTNNLTHIPQLVFSRDGRHFSRTPGRPDFLPLGARGDFDDRNVYVVSAILHDGRIWFFYTGGRWRGVHDLLDMGADARDAIGLATLPLDGFASIEAGPNPGVLTTQAVVFSGQQLVINVEASQKGYGLDELTSVQIEILDEKGRPITGFSCGQTDPIHATNQNQRVSWNGRLDLGSLAGRPVSIRFCMKNARLYSFQFR